MPKLVSATLKIFSQREVLKNESPDVYKEISEVVIRKNYGILLPAAVVVILITVSFVLSDISTEYWSRNYPYSLLNISGEILHAAAGIMFILSRLDRKVRNKDLRRMRAYSSLFLAVSTLSFSLYSLSDVLKSNTTSAHYFVLMLLAVLPVLTNAEFFIYYVVIYIAPSLVAGIILGSVEVLTFAIYFSAYLLHWLLRANFTRAELNRIRYERANHELEKMSMTDPLTRVGNRGLLYKLLGERTGDWAQSNETVCLVMIDIDKFKNYNDTYSHLKGDECLVSIAAAISGVLNSQDTAESLFIRFGGEEFMFMLIGREAEKALMSVYQRIRREIRALELHSGKGADGSFVTVSLGAHIFEYKPDTVFEEELKEADKQLYMVKENGRDGLGYKNTIYRGAQQLADEQEREDV